MNQMNRINHINKEISWLSFNERVLQEAGDNRNPIGERIRFLGIFSSNQDEFFRVRVSALKKLCLMNRHDKIYLIDDPEKIHREVISIVKEQRERHNQIYRELIDKMCESNTSLINDTMLSEMENEFVVNYFNAKVRPAIFPIMIDTRYKLPYLKDEALYLAVELKNDKKNTVKIKYSIIEIPLKVVPRFVAIPGNADNKKIIFIDDVVRVGLKYIFNNNNYNSLKAYNIKITRDAELEIDSDDIYHSYVDKINKSIEKRKEGDPIRIIYDREMPREMLNLFIKKLKLHRLDTVFEGDRYHNLKDLIKLPDIADLPQYKKLNTLELDDINPDKDVIHSIKKRDILLYFPYHSFDIIIDMLRQASIDPKVTEIKVSLYRVASFSSITNALINARKNRKKVTVHFELQARFDEENNIYWAKKLREEGIRVFFGIEGLKVHSKLCLIKRREAKKEVMYSCIGTGNLNENTAKLYTDCCLLTHDTDINSEIDYIFNFLEKSYSFNTDRVNELLISPFNTRKHISKLIDSEIKNAKNGKEAWIMLKVNNLVDRAVEKKLYEASQAGVKIRIICRGRFSLIPGEKGLSENIEAISIVDMFLEHARFFIFCNNNKNKAFIGSADLQTRNLDRRIEVTTPIKNEKLIKQLKDIFEIQWKDNVKARILNSINENRYRETTCQDFKSQEEVYKYLKNYSKLY